MAYEWATHKAITSTGYPAYFDSEYEMNLWIKKHKIKNVERFEIKEGIKNAKQSN